MWIEHEIDITKKTSNSYEVTAMTSSERRALLPAPSPLAGSSKKIEVKC
jgi:hypothetical protein